MSNLAKSLFRAAAQYDNAQTRAEIEYGIVTRADPGPPMVVEVRLRRAGADTNITVSTAKGTLALTEACIWKSVTLGHTHGGAVPADLDKGLPPGDRYHPSGQAEPMEQYSGSIHSPYIPYTTQDGLHVGDRVILLRGLAGYKYIALTRIHDKF